MSSTSDGWHKDAPAGPAGGFVDLVRPDPAAHGVVLRLVQHRRRFDAEVDIVLHAHKISFIVNTCGRIKHCVRTLHGTGTRDYRAPQERCRLIEENQ
jgi:hypothetical protein